MIHKFFTFLLFIALISCTDEEVDQEETTWYKPAPSISFDWDLRDNIPADITYNATIIDIDGFENSSEFVANLKADNKKVFAYISVGSIEDWRSDVADFPSEVIGNNYPSWDGEKFIDISNIDALAPIMRARLDMVKAKGFDGIEPDNMDLHSWTTTELGFEITETDVINYAKWLAEEAHSRGLSIGQKNASDLSEELVNVFDWILLEDPFFENYQDEAQTYIDHNKAVFATEYTDNTSSETFSETVCAQANALQYTAILKHRELDAFIETCE